MVTNHLIKNKVASYQGACSFCKEWEGKIRFLASHQSSCDAYYKAVLDELDEVVKEQIKVLDLEINPHLNKNHK